MVLEAGEEVSLNPDLDTKDKTNLRNFGATSEEALEQRPSQVRFRSSDLGNRHLNISSPVTFVRGSESPTKEILNPQSVTVEESPSMDIIVGDGYTQNLRPTSEVSKEEGREESSTHVMADSSSNPKVVKKITFFSPARCRTLT